MKTIKFCLFYKSYFWVLDTRKTKHKQSLYMLKIFRFHDYLNIEEHSPGDKNIIHTNYTRLCLMIEFI